MANVERLTKRVKEMENWIAENKSGPTLDNFNYLLDITRRASDQGMNVTNEYQNYRRLSEEFLSSEELGDKWNAFLENKESEKNAVQEEKTEEESVQEEEE